MNKINNINRRKFLEIFGGCTCGLIITSCTTAPITERKQLKLFPESALNRQAAQIYENVKRKTKLSDDKKQLEEIKEIGSRIEEAVSLYFESINKKDPTYNFHWEYVLIDNDKIKKKKFFRKIQKLLYCWCGCANPHRDYYLFNNIFDVNFIKNYSQGN